MKNNNFKSYLYLSLAMIMVGSSFVVGKLISSTMPIFLSSFLSLLIASVLFIPTVVLAIKSKKLTKKDYYYLGLQGLLGTVLYRIFLFISLKYVDAGYAGILSALQPAMIALLAIFFLGEKQTRKEKIGIGLAVVGLIIVYLSNKIAVVLGSQFIFGTILVILAVFGEACFSVFAKKLNKNIKPMVIAGMVTVMSCVMSLPPAMYDIYKYGFNISFFGALLIAYYGIFLTYISFIFWFKGLKQVSASIAGVFTALIPVSGVIFSIILLKDLPSFYEVVGGLLIVLSIFLVVYKKE